LVPWPESKVSTKQMIKHNFFVSKNREYHQVFHASHKTDEPNPLVSLFDSDGLAGEDLAEIDFLPIEADSSAGGDGGGPVMEGIFDVRQAAIRPWRRTVPLRRTLHVEGLVRPLVVVQRSLRTPTGPFFARFFIGIILGLVAEFAFMGQSTRVVLSSSAARWKSRKQIGGLKCRHGCSTGRHALTPGFWQLNRMSASRHLRRSLLCSVWR